MDEQKIKILKEDLELVTQTAQILAVKLQKMTTIINELISEKTVSSSPKTSATVVKEMTKTKAYIVEEPPQKVSPPEEPPRKMKTVRTISPISDSKVGRLLDDFVEKFNQMKTGYEVYSALSTLRDQLMSAATKHSTVFSEIGRLSSSYKNVKDLTAEHREELLEKIRDWKIRLVG